MTDARDKSSIDKAASNAPNISVVVPVYNSIEYLKLSLAALAESDYDNFEIIVVDDGSTEPVEPVVSSHGFTYTRIDGPGGPARARNRGVEVARGQYIIFIDADVCVSKDTLTRFAQAFEDHQDVAAVIGSYDDAPAQPNFLSQYKNLFHHYTHQRSDGDISTFWSGCGAIRREMFLAFGGFDEQHYRRPAIEDIELGTWMKIEGHRIILDSRITVKHLKRWSFWKLIKTDIFDRGIPWTRLMLRAGARADTLNVKRSQQLSVALIYLIILSIVLSLQWPVVWFITTAMAAVLLVLNFDFYRYMAARRGVWFALGVLPMHWLYFLYCGFSAAAGTLLHFAADRNRSSSDKPRARAHS